MTWKWPVKWPLPSSHLTTNPLMNDISLTRFRFDVQQLVSNLNRLFLTFLEKSKAGKTKKQKSNSNSNMLDRGCSSIANGCRLVIRVAHAK
jgi:hypothetical protein